MCCYQHSTSCFDLYLSVLTLCRISRMHGRPGSCWTWWFCSSPSCDHAWHDCYVLLWRQSISTRRGISEHQKLRSTKLITKWKVFVLWEIILSVMNNIWWIFFLRISFMASRFGSQVVWLTDGRLQKWYHPTTNLFLMETLKVTYPLAS